MQGLKYRMGQVWKPNKAMPISLIKKVLMYAENMRKESLSFDRLHLWTVFIGYSIVSYVISLRGSEGFLLDINGIINNWKRNDGRYFFVALMGKIKGEHVDRQHLVPCANETGSGIKVKNIVKRLILEKQKVGITHGPLISDVNGNMLTAAFIDEMLQMILKKNTMMIHRTSLQK